MRSLGWILIRLGGWLYRRGCRLQVGGPAQANPFARGPAPALFVAVVDERPTVEMPVVGGEEVH